MPFLLFESEFHLWHHLCTFVIHLLRRKQLRSTCILSLRINRPFSVGRLLAPYRCGVLLQVPQVQDILIRGHLLDLSKPEMQTNQVANDHRHQERENAQHQHHSHHSSRPVQTKHRPTSPFQPLRVVEPLQQHPQRHCYEQQFSSFQHTDQREEETVVALADAVVEPLAVVVEADHAAVAVAAVLGTAANASGANGAHRGVAGRVEGLAVWASLPFHGLAVLVHHRVRRI